ncbi:Zinc finger protein [Triplophysa tibetana]|uniref:Zinc finger protein n=1 Tax=Triplophysa tibetana TaxID=1572043 RepID=A0A5A9NUL5_9TELE|nr:Zinc finger protein [Triplophysa tibetana]
MLVAAQQNLHDRLMNFGIKKEISRKLEQRVKERNSEEPIKPKQLEQVVQSRPRSSSFPSSVTRVMSGPAPKQHQTPQPTPRSRTRTLPKTSTPLQQHKTPPFSSDEETSEEEEESEEETPPTQKKAPQVNRTTVKAQMPKTHLSSTPHTTTPADRTAVTALSMSDSEWMDGSEMDEINVSELHKHTDQNGNVEKTSYSNVKALSKSLEKQLEARGPKKPPGGVNMFQERPTVVKNIKHDEKKDLKYTDEDDDDDWDISSLEDVPAVSKPNRSPAPIRRSLDKSLDTSTSIWGSSAPKGQKAGLTDAGTGSTLKSSLVTVSDWDDLDEI